MSMEQALLLVAGIAAIIWVNWYFLFSKRAEKRAGVGAGGMQEVVITVKGGYSPDVIRVTHDEPVRLVFDRQETSGCSEEVVLSDFGIRRFLPAFARTTIEFTPTQAGKFQFTCGMNMLHGQLIVE